MQYISQPVINNLSEKALRLVQQELITSVEALRADDIRPAKSVAGAIRELHEAISLRELRKERSAAIRLVDLTAGTIVTLTGCNGTWSVIGARDWHAIKVQPENLSEDPIWVDASDITSIVS